MDMSCLPQPPLTVTYSVSFTYKDMTPSNTPVILRAKVCPAICHRTGSCHAHHVHAPITRLASEHRGLVAQAGEVTRSEKSGKQTVEVELGLFLPQLGGGEKQLVKGTGIYKKFGALRAL